MKTILLTGITGFIAKRIAKDLLDQGYHVRGSLRSMSRADEVRAALGAPEQLDFVELDLGKDDGWTEAMKGVDALLHTASPFPLVQPKDEQEIIKPAVDGTLRALRAADAAGITRVVLTSSMVAIMHVDRPAEHKFGPQDWTDINHPTASAYVKSKTLAEKAAWDFVADHPDMQLTTIHPGLVCGTPMDRHFGTSLEVIERIWLGKDPMVPNFCLPVVDLADVSALHVAALNTPASVGQRVIAAESAWMYPEMASILKQAFPDRKISDRKAPKLVLRLLSMFDPAVKSILPQLDRVLEIDNSNARSLFDHHFVSGREAMIASAKFLEAQQNG